MINQTSSNPHIGVALSGGVDSAITVYLLQKAGYQVQGYTMALWHPETNTQQIIITKAKQVANFFKIKHHIIDLKTQFKKEVVNYFQNNYTSGLTPNPCAICNRHIKLGAFWEAVHKNGATKLATGHYANIISIKENRIAIAKGADTTKDQSYFLALVPQATLKHLYFPLANYTKSDIKKIAQEIGLYELINKSESQEICFVPNDNYRQLLIDLGTKTKPGNIIHQTTGQKLGQHNGLWHYTVGQRRGLGISYSEPLYVTKLDSSSNTVYLDNANTFNTSTIIITDLNWQYALANDLPLNAEIKIRYRTKPMPCTINNHPTLPNAIIATTTQPIKSAVTPGQLAVIYNINNNAILCGGTIN